MKNLFSTHLARLQQTVQSLLENAFLDGLWIYAGKAKTLFLDDQTVPFKINPYFNYFFPYPQAENCWLFLDGKNKPKIYFYAPEDYWVSTLKVPTEAFFAAEFEWVLLRAENEIATFIQNPTACAFIGEDVELAKKLGFSHINPQKVLNSLNFARSIKTEFEIESIYQAQFSALKGHQVAKEAFFVGKSEFEINLEYLKATQQSDLNVPYGNIVAINQNGAVLHYTALDFDTHAKRHSFLIDAGTTVNGYASDLTRTYAFDSGSEFAELVAKMEQLKLQIIAELSIGVNYLHYHTRMQQMISQLLAEHQFIHLSAEQIFEQGISRTFFPHGLGHLLGIQVHDVGGFQQNA
ncbi:TPA: Xaa-Pro dipeptidase, partial [Mannheimia haemolytica]|nr:Xaa-Pro dipeptidase [Mannheimia haemolytica]